ncbi:hypothetical protein V5E97_06795 [Singulisphaera sp. Ch08]|uniref:Portal protein n=1 Tax=Singulisphaera sp. Ch08 TaxID=3120278 RepID=A0AAU7CKP2_9BACT
MSYFGSTVYTTGYSEGSPVIGEPIKNPRPEQEYIAAGPGRLTPAIPQILGKEFDDVTRNFGSHPYEVMLTDPAVYSSYLALKLAILSGPIQIQPRIKPLGYRYSPPATRKQRPAKPGKVLSGDEAQAQEVADFCERELARLRTPIKATLLQMYDCMGMGSKLAEPTRELCESGPDKGRLGLKSVKVKPEWAWQYVVDAFMNVVGIITFVPSGVKGSESGFLILPPEKFAIMTWLPKDNDPRGTSALRAAYDWWNLKQQVKPYYYAHLQRFGSPSLDGVLSENDTAPGPAVDSVTGQEIPGKIVSPGQRYASQLVAFANNTVVVRPAGSELHVIEPKSNGEAFLNGFNLFDQQICLAIGLQTRASLEAKHGSKADSETAENTRGLVIDYGREAGSDWLEKQLLYDSVALNFGKDVADALMPIVIISQTEQQDLPAKWTAAASVGYTLGESQLEEMDADLGLPERDMEADKAAADEAAQKAADLAAKMAPPGGPPESGEKGSKGTPPKAKPSGKPASGKPSPKGDK